jgi:hypothetical protein
MSEDPRASAPFIDALEPEPDESLILTVLLDRDGSGALSLRHASAVIAPPDCAEVSWGVWRSRQTRRTVGLCPNSSPARFLIERDTRVAGRTTMTGADGAEWLVSVADAESAQDPRLPKAPGLPNFEGLLEAPSALVRVFPGTDQPSGLFLGSAARPALGTIWTVDDRRELVLPPMVQYADAGWLATGQCLLGMHVPIEGGFPSSPPFGMLVARLERRAWLTEVRGDGPDFEALLAHIGWDPSRIDLMDLVVDLEQFISGDLVAQVRIPIEDTAGADDLREAGSCAVSLPTYGPGVASHVTLSTRDGALLDRTGPYPLAERVIIRRRWTERKPLRLSSAVIGRLSVWRTERQGASWSTSRSPSWLRRAPRGASWSTKQRPTNACG